MDIQKKLQMKITTVSLLKLKRRPLKNYQDLVTLKFNTGKMDQMKAQSSSIGDSYLRLTMLSRMVKSL